MYQLLVMGRVPVTMTTTWWMSTTMLQTEVASTHLRSIVGLGKLQVTVSVALSVSVPVLMPMPVLVSVQVLAGLRGDRVRVGTGH